MPALPVRKNRADQEENPSPDLSGWGRGSAVAGTICANDLGAGRRILGDGLDQVYGS